MAETSEAAKRLVTEAVNRASRWAGPAAEATKNGGDKKEEPQRSTGGQGPAGNGMFADADNMRSQIRQELGKKDYDISDFYYKTGIFQKIARNTRWQSVTLVVIAVNSLWIGLEIELNKEANLNDALWPFQVGEYFFCAFFVFEWFTRFFALEKKRNGLRDKWFVFDACLVFMMVAETLVLPHALPSSEETSGDEDEEGSGGQDVGQLGMLRMLRLLRLTRMVRFMRSVPELVTLLKSMGLAGRPVLSTLLLLLCLLYTFGIIFKSQLQAPPGSKLHEKFGRVRSAMLTLLYQGTLLDSIGKTANPLLDESLVLTGLFIIFILLSSFTVLNLLIGMVCEVVNVVALTEKEKAMVAYVKGKLISVLEELDEDGNGTISKSEFDKLMEVPTAINALRELGIDLPNLVSLSDHLFEEEELTYEKRSDREEDELFDLMNWQKTYSATVTERDVEGKLSISGKDIERAQLLQSDDEEHHLRFDDNASHSNTTSDEGKCLTFGDFIEMVIRLRPDSHPSVVDCVDLRKLYLKGQKQIHHHLESLEEMNAKLATDIQRNICHHPLFIVICNHPEMRARMRGSSSLPMSRGGTGSMSAGMHCWSRSGMPEARREDNHRKLNVCDEAAGLSNRGLQQVLLSEPLDKAEDDRSISSREREVPEERSDMPERLKARASSRYLGRHRAGQTLSGRADSGASCSASTGSSSGRRPSEGKLARILAATSSSSGASGKAAEFSKGDRAWQLDEVFLKDNKTRQLDEAVLGRVLDAASALCDEDESWALGTPKAFRSGREQTNTTGTGSATTGSSVDVEAESFELQSECASVAAEGDVDILGQLAPSPMVAEKLVDDDQRSISRAEGLSGVFSCTPSSLCCGQTNTVQPSPVPLSAVCNEHEAADESVRQSESAFTEVLESGIA